MPATIDLDLPTALARRHAVPLHTLRAIIADTLDAVQDDLLRAVAAMDAADPDLGTAARVLVQRLGYARGRVAPAKPKHPPKKKRGDAS